MTYLLPKHKDSIDTDRLIADIKAAAKVDGNSAIYEILIALVREVKQCECEKGIEDE
jgi:hypothetical protein